MSTTVLGRKNDYNLGNNIDEDELNALVDDLEWVAAGYLSKSVAGGTDVTLTEAEYEVSVLELTGTLAANINVILPAHAGRRWVILNNTSGSFTLTAKTSGGSGVAITQGFAALVAGDGTDIERVGPDTSTAGGIVVTSPRIATSIKDSNGNTILLLSATASAVNWAQLVNGATGVGPILQAEGETNVDLTLRGKGTGGVQISRSGGKLAFFGATLQARAAALTQTYATADRTLSAYTADNESAAYTGIDNAQAGTVYAQLADLNNLRTAYENLRALTEDLAQFVNAVVDDLQAYGLEQ